MYCLDCGKKINDDELQCPHCGSSVIAMKERIAKAHEQIVYADAVPAAETSRLPLVSERSYVDKEGNPLDPKAAVDVDEVSPRHHDDLTAIPELGYSDPYLTAPMQRIVSSDGRVVADVDRNAKVYVQQAPRRKFPVRILVGVLIVAALAACAWFFGPSVAQEFQEFVDANTTTQQQAPSPSTAAQEQEQQASTTETTQEYTADDLLSELIESYSNLKSYRSEVDNAVDNLEGYYQVSKTATRQGYADSCKELQASLTKERAALKENAQKAKVSADAALNTKYQNIDALYGYLLDRLDVIAQCWEVSLGYDSPKSHSSEILAPLKSDLKNGNSISEAAFDELYPKADPSK